MGHGIIMGYHGEIMRTLRPTTVYPIRVSAKIWWPKMAVVIAKLMIRHETIYGKVLDTPNFQPDPSAKGRRDPLKLMKHL